MNTVALIATRGGEVLPSVLDALSRRSLRLLEAPIDTLEGEVVRLSATLVVLDGQTLRHDDDRRLRRLRSQRPDLVLVAWLATPDHALATRLLRAGVTAFLLPSQTVEEMSDAVGRAIDGELVLPRGLSSTFVTEFLEVEAENREGKARVEFALESLQAQLAELEDTYRATVEALASAVELRDEYTGGHIARVRDYSLVLASAIDPALATTQHAFGYMLHDIGKLAIPDAILLKPGPLTTEEFEVIKLHTIAGARFIENIPFLRDMVPVVRNHHERWDGRGYPDGLSGDRIPLIARIFTVADALDAITTDRPYRKAHPLPQALQEIRRCAGTQFDPEVVDVFLTVVEHDETFADLRSGTVPGRHHLPNALIRAFAAGRPRPGDRPLGAGDPRLRSTSWTAAES